MEKGRSEMGVLNSITRRQLLNALESISVFDNSVGRDMLLRDLPPKLRNRIERSSAKATDLDQIVFACDIWPSAAADADYPLRVLLQNAVDLTAGAQIQKQLQELLAG